jgi:hypothetical protein
MAVTTQKKKKRRKTSQQEIGYGDRREAKNGRIGGVMVQWYFSQAIYIHNTHAHAHAHMQRGREKRSRRFRNTEDEVVKVSRRSSRPIKPI